MPNTITPSVLHHIHAELSRRGRGDRTAYAKSTARRLGVSVSTLYRQLGKIGLGTGITRQRDRTRPEISEWAKTLAALAAKAPKHQIPLDLCLKQAVLDGTLPPEAGNISVSHYQKVLREDGLRPKEKRTRKLKADYCMQAVQIDASTSEYLRVIKALPDGDYLLRLHRSPLPKSGYKNKPLGPDRLRLMVYASWEMYTGYEMARYTVARGESGFDAMDFLCWTMAEQPDPRIPYHGVMEDLWSDQGPLVKLKASLDLLDRLEINPHQGKPYAKEAQGGVEATNARRWRRFESSLFLQCKGNELLEMTLSELNARLMEYLIEENDRPSQRPDFRRTGLSRKAAWMQSMNRQGGVRRCPDDPMSTIATEARRWVDQSGIFRWDNIEYELPRLHSTWVVARRSLTEDGLVVCEHIDTGERHEAREHVPLSYGQHRGTAKTEADRTVERAEDVSLANDIYAPQAGTAATKVAQIPTRTQAAKPLDNPLDARRHPDIDTAMREFFRIYGGPLDDRNRQLIEQRIRANDLDKDMVRELALELSGLRNHA